MDDLDRVSEKVCDLYPWGTDKEYGRERIIEDGVRYLLDWSKDHTGGLEGWYSDEITGTYYENNKAYYFTITDVFCSETGCVVERDVGADLVEGDDDYIEPEGKRELFLGEWVEPSLLTQPCKFTKDSLKYHLQCDDVEILEIDFLECEVVVCNSSLDYEEIAAILFECVPVGVRLHGLQGYATLTTSGLLCEAGFTHEKLKDNFKNYITCRKMEIEINNKIELAHHASDRYNETQETNTATTAHDEQTNLNNKSLEDINMANTQTDRQILTFILVDEDKNLPVEWSLVYKFEDVITEDDVQTTREQLLVDSDIKGILAEHNTMRGKIVNETILERTGAEVMLKPVTIKDLTWKVK